MPHHTDDPRRPRPTLAPLAGAMLTALALLTTPHAGAQATEYELGDDGWERTATPEPGTAEYILARAAREIDEGNPRQARRLLDPWIEANKRRGHPLLARAYLYRGHARLAQGREDLALIDYEAVIAQAPGSEEFATAVEHEVEVALQYLGGLRRRLLGFRIERAFGLGEELLVRAQERMPGSRLAERAAINLADHYYRHRQMVLASEMYEIFVTNFPESEHRERAMLRRIYANVARFKGPEYDSGGLLEAALLIDDFMRRYPAAAEREGITRGLLARIDESAARQLVDTAGWYLQRGDEPSAEFTLRRLLRRHPESAAAQDAVRLMQDRGWIDADEAHDLTEGDEP